MRSRKRENVAALVNADPREIIWTSGATESDNLAIKGAANFYKGKGKHIITVKTEHKAVLDTCRELERDGFEVTYLDVKDDGLIDLDVFKAALRPDTILVSVMHVNNEIGVIQDIETIGEICREGHRVPRRRRTVDRQGRDRPREAEGRPDVVLGAQDLRPEGHRRAYVRRKPRVRIEAQMHGGGHERGMRSGTLATHQIVGMGEAFRIAREEMATENERIRMLRDKLLRGLSQIEETYVNGDMERRVPHNLNISFNFVEGESLIMAIKDVAVSSACMHVGVAGAVVRAACARPQRRAGLLDPLHGRPLHDGAGSRLRDQPAEQQDREAARTLAALGNAPGRHRSVDDRMGRTLSAGLNIPAGGFAHADVTSQGV